MGIVDATDTEAVRRIRALLRNIDRMAADGKLAEFPMAEPVTDVAAEWLLRAARDDVDAACAWAQGVTAVLTAATSKRAFAARCILRVAAGKVDGGR